MKVCLIVLIIVILTSMIAGQEQKVLTAEDFAKGNVDRGSGRESLALKIQINKRLPPYTIHIIPDPAASDSEGSDIRLHHVGWIEISAGESNSILQKIDIHTRAWVSNLTGYFTAEDVNFDGFIDIAVVNDYGAKWVSVSYWLYDKRTGRFITSPLTKELKRITHAERELDNKTKQIRFTDYIGVCPQNKTYKVTGGHLLLMEKEEKVCTWKGKEVLIKTIVKKRINGRMKLVKLTRETEEATGMLE